MTLEFRDHQVLVVAPRSQTTHFQMGLVESLTPATYEVPTVVYRDAATGKFRTAPSEAGTDEAIHPIVRGAIADEAAFHYLLKMIYRSVKSLDGLPPALYITASLSWNRRQTERLARYLFEEVGVPALDISLQGLSTAYAFATSDCLVIDVGAQKTEVSAVVGYEVNRDASQIIPHGGADVNKTLQRLLPQLSETQIEDLKRSPIYAVMNADERLNDQAMQMIDDDEGVVDIAAIVSSGRTREILDRREKQKHGELHEVTNAELKENTFVDRNGETVTVGRERFEGSEELMLAIAASIADVLERLSPREQAHVFENVIFVGSGLLIAGLRERLAEMIESRYVIRPRGASGVIAHAEDAESHVQGPTALTVARLPDHFPEWKNHRWEDAPFLGAQIGAKQVFTTGMEGVFVSRQDYNEVGPACIWDIFS